MERFRQPNEKPPVTQVPLFVVRAGKTRQLERDAEVVSYTAIPETLGPIVSEVLASGLWAAVERKR